MPPPGSSGSSGSDGSAPIPFCDDVTLHLKWARNAGSLLYLVEGNVLCTCTNEVKNSKAQSEVIQNVIGNMYVSNKI